MKRVLRDCQGFSDGSGALVAGGKSTGAMEWQRGNGLGCQWNGSQGDLLEDSKQMSPITRMRPTTGCWMSGQSP